MLKNWCSFGRHRKLRNDKGTWLLLYNSIDSSTLAAQAYLTCCFHGTSSAGCLIADFDFLTVLFNYIYIISSQFFPCRRCQDGMVHVVSPKCCGGRRLGGIYQLAIYTHLARTRACFVLKIDRWGGAARHSFLLIKYVFSDVHEKMACAPSCLTNSARNSLCRGKLYVNEKDPKLNISNN